MLAAWLTLMAGLAYPLRNLPAVLPWGMETHQADACSGGMSGHGSWPGAAHDTHCLFCLTGAFADVPPFPLAVSVGADPRAEACLPDLRVAHAFMAHADARAPPGGPVRGCLTLQAPLVKPFWRKYVPIPPLCLALLLPVAAAHATVRTETGLTESKVGVSETYRLNIPNETTVDTTQVRLLVPAGVTITRFQVMPGFFRTVKLNSAGLVTEVIWRGRIAPQEYARFFFQARNPEEAGTLSWKMDQTYADGSVVAWDDTDPEKAPASKTTVK